MTQLMAYLQLMRWHRPIGFLLLLWPTLWALWIAAHGIPSFSLVVIFGAGVVIMRSAGCVINDIADRDFDGHVSRTKMRPLVQGTINLKQALTLFVFLCVLAFVLVLFLQPFTILLSIIGVLLAIFYPFAKRFVPIPQMVLGLAFAWGVPMVFAEIEHHLSFMAWLLFAATFFWIVAYDTQYAMADRLDDVKLGIKSSAIFFGRFECLWIGIFQGMMMLLLLFLGMKMHLNGFFYFMLAIATVLIIYQHYLTITRNSDKCILAFNNNNWIGAVIFLGIVLSV